MAGTPSVVLTIAGFDPSSGAGITADIEFDGKGDLTNGLLTIFEVKGGKWQVVSK